jgi:parallel beta-helix repeat protein
MNVSGIIYSDTMWTKVNSPYVLTGPLLVNNSVTLTIESGVTVYLNDSYLRVDGTLNAQGTNTDKISLIRNDTSLASSSESAIQFTDKSADWNETSKTGSIIENAIISNAQGNSNTISITDSSPKISNCTIINTGDQGSVIIKGATPPIISNNIITSNSFGIEIRPSLALFGNACISGNIISGCDMGIYVVLGSPIIERNLIINNNDGIEVDYSGTTPIIRNNTIVKNSVGINILESPSPTIEFNNIYDNNEYSIYLYSRTGEGSGSNINATYNWWGTTDTQAINQTIYDFKNDFNLATVTFAPILTMSNPAAPVIPTFTVTASAGSGGAVNPTGAIILNWGDTQTFNITANTGYHILDVLVNETSVGDVSSYTFDNIQASYTISATFAPDPTPSSAPVITEFPSWITPSLLIMIVIGASLLTYFKKRKH